MVAQSAKKATDNAKRYTTCQPGQCLKYTRTWLEIGSYYGDATTAWKNAAKKHTDRNPPAGAPVFWTGGNKGYGHAALSLGNGKIRTTDAPSSGKVTTQDLSWPANAWGLKYAGWTEDVNKVTIPYLAGSTAAGSTEGDDVTAKHFYGKRTETLAMNATWRGIGWTSSGDEKVTSPGGSYQKIGGCNYVSALNATFSKVTGSNTLRTRLVEYDENDKVAKTWPITEHSLTTGDTGIGDTRTGYCGKGHKLRWEVYADNGTMISAQVQLTYFT